MVGDRPKPWEVNLLPLLPAAVVPPVHGEAVYLETVRIWGRSST